VTSIGIVSEYRASFHAPHHDLMQGTRSVDSRSPFPTLAGQLDNIEVVSQPRITPGGKAQADSKAQHTRQYVSI
jgi:hypothetical protein